MRATDIEVGTHARRFRILDTALAAAAVGLLGWACAAADEVRSEAAPSTVEHASAERLTADVAWLADDAREGRRAGTAGERASAEWIGQRFAELGLEPAGEDGTWFQAFQVPLPIADGGASSIAWDEGRIEGSDSVLPLFCSDGAQASGPLVWRGYGIVDADRGRDDYGGQRVDGAVVLVVRGAPELPEPPAEEHDDTALVSHGEGWGNSASLFTKVMNAKRRGAVAVIVAEHPDHAGEMLAFDPGHSAQANVPALYITAAAAGRLISGYADFMASAEADDFVPAEGPHVSVRADVRRESGEALNVLARVRGAAGGAGRTVVIGAHFDHLGHGGEGSLAGGVEAIHNGADDNASGTAVVLEMARLWSQGQPPAADVVFALWSGEELGLLGSEYWARNPTLDLDDVACNLNLDMVGRAGDQVLTVLGAGTAEEFSDWLAAAAVPAGLDLKINRSGQGVGGSDHQTFLKRQIPAVHFFSGLHGDYHKPSDDLERFEADGAARVCDLGVAFVGLVQDADEVAFVEVAAPESGQASQRSTSWRVWFGTVPEYAYEGEGLLLSGTSAGSPAEKAGLLAGDVIVKVGEIDVQNIHDFVYVLQVYKPGNVVLTRFVRDGEEQEVRLTLGTRDVQ